jgi:choline dehydrogenase-like flavoprotein
MGNVVDSSLRVIGAEKLRVVDESMIPVPLASHYQVAVFAIAEQAIDIILSEIRIGSPKSGIKEKWTAVVVFPPRLSLHT